MDLLRQIITYLQKPYSRLNVCFLPMKLFLDQKMTTLDVRFSVQGYTKFSGPHCERFGKTCLNPKMPGAKATLLKKIGTQGPSNRSSFFGGILKSPTNLRGLEYLVINVSLANSVKVTTPNQWR